MTEIVILELPVNHVSIILEILQAGIENYSLEEKHVAILKEIKDNLIRQIEVLQ